MALIDGLESLSIAASDGQSWFTSWDSDSEGLPHAVVVSVRAVDALGQSRATRRAVVTFDRSPVPAELEAQSDEADDQAETDDAAPAGTSSGSSTPGSSGTGTTGAGGGTNTGGRTGGSGGTSGAPR